MSKQCFQFPQLERNQTPHKTTPWSKSCSRAQIQTTLLGAVNDIDSSLTNSNDSILTPVLLFDEASLDISAKTPIVNATVNYIISTNRFEERFF